MVKLQRGHSEEVLSWLSRSVNFTLDPHTILLWATSDEGHVLGAIGLGGKMGRTFGSISIALTTSRVALPLVRAAAVLLFGELHAVAGYVTIGSRRPKWIQSLKTAVGFKEVDRVRCGLGPKEDLVILKLTPERCRPWQAELRKWARKAASEVA